MISRGIALIQTLLIVAILTVIALFMSYSARQQVKLAQLSVDRALAMVKAHDAEAMLTYSMLVNEKTSVKAFGDGSESQEVSRQWNFYGTPFYVSDYVEVTLQDQSSLINLHYPNKDALIKLLLAVSTDFVARSFVDKLLDWQDVDTITQFGSEESERYGHVMRNAPIYNLRDLTDGLGASPEVAFAISKYTSRYRVGDFNPLNAPFAVLSAFADSTAASRIQTYRENGQSISKNEFIEVTGMIDSEETFFYPGKEIEMTINSRVGEVEYRVSKVLYIEPYPAPLRQPVVLLQTNL